MLKVSAVEFDRVRRYEHVGSLHEMLEQGLRERHG